VSFEIQYETLQILALKVANLVGLAMPLGEPCY